MPSHVRLPAPEDWPVVASGPVHDEDLSIVTNQQRGAVRFTGAGASADLRLHAILDFDQRPGVVAFEPGFVGADFVEFYGLDAGRRSLWLERDGRSSALLEVAVVPHEITKVELPQLAPQTTRRLVVEGAGAAGATLLLEFEGVEVLRRWRGEPLELRSPLTHPRRIAVSLPTGPSGTRRLGAVHTVEAATGDLRVALPDGERSVRLVAGDAARPESRYALELTAGLRVTVEAAQPTTKNLFAMLRPGEFVVPPKVHTWSGRQLGQEIVITGVGAGEAWVGVGLERIARYVLWRKQPDGTEAVTRVAPTHAATFHGESARLPLWIRSLGREEPLASGSRAEHDYGPGEFWEHEESATGKWRRLAAWVDGLAGRRELAAREVALPLPPDLQPGDELSLMIRVPHALHGQGLRFVLDHRCDGPFRWPALPDGLVDGVLRRRGQPVAVLHSAIRDGTFLGRASAWSDSDAVAEDWRQLQLRAVDGSGAGIAGADVYSESGATIATTDAEGRCRIERTAPARRPTFVSVRAAGRFTTNGYAGGIAFELASDDRAGPQLDWSALQALLGLDLGSLGIDMVMLGRQPLGETTRMSADTRAAIVPTDTIEFAGGQRGGEIWGWFDGATATGPSGSAPPATAEIVVVNYTASRTVHLSLPRTEVRLGLDRGRLQRVVVHAPARVSLTSVVTIGLENETAIVDEGIAAEVAAGDVLVVTYGGR